MNDPIPIEQTHPELAEHIRLVANRAHPHFRSIDFGKRVVRLHSGKMVAMSQIGRNDPCRCGSGKKFKKCCG